MAHGEVHHDYHLVNPSPWPLVGSIGVATLFVGLVAYMKGIANPDTTFLIKGSRAAGMDKVVDQLRDKEAV